LADTLSSAPAGLEAARARGRLERADDVERRQLTIATTHFC
jgi:hypothetical protein